MYTICTAERLDIFNSNALLEEDVKNVQKKSKEYLRKTSRLNSNSKCDKNCFPEKNVSHLTRVLSVLLLLLEISRVSRTILRKILFLI